MPSAAECAVPWRHHHRIVPSRFPPINAFEDTADPADLDAVFEFEALTNSRLRVEAGDIRLVEAADRISGPGSSPVMAAFTHIGREGRFNTRDFGAYYAASTSEAAIAETRFHRERFLRRTAERATRLEMREYVGDPTSHPMLDLRGDAHRDLLQPDPDRYAPAQQFALERRQEGASGILFPSVRLSGQECLAAFRPRAVGPVRQGPHFLYCWDGRSIYEVVRLN
ncbi:MAG: RES family NAD+ phosphorylase [Pseudomonadota bacterium]